MKVILLGTGTTIPSTTRNAAGTLIQCTDYLLFDCGNGILRQIEKAGINFTQVAHIFISHLHADHLSDLPILLKANLMQNNSMTITIFGPSTLKHKLEIWFSEIYPYLNEVLNKVEIQEVSGSTLIKGEDWTVETFPVNHGLEAYGLKLTSNGKVIVYSGDTGASEELIKVANGADLLIHECSYPSNLQKFGHTTPLEVGLIAQRAKVKQLVLTHFYPECQGREKEMEEDIRKNYDGGIIFGKDLQSLEVK